MEQSEQAAGGRPSDDWDAALRRLLDDVQLGDLHVVRTGEGPARLRLTFEAMREAVAERLRERKQAEEQRRRALIRLQRKFEETTGVVDQMLDRFVSALLDRFHGGGRVDTQAELKGKSWKILAARTQSTRSGALDPVITVTLTMRGTDALDRGAPALEWRVSTARNPRLADFTVAEEFPSDLEDALCRAYQDIVGTMRFAPDALSDRAD